MCNFASPCLLIQRKKIKASLAMLLKRRFKNEVFWVYTTASFDCVYWKPPQDATFYKNWKYQWGCYTHSYSSSWVLPHYGDILGTRYYRLSIMPRQTREFPFGGVCHIIYSLTLFNQANSVALGMTVSDQHFGALCLYDQLPAKLMSFPLASAELCAYG